MFGSENGKHHWVSALDCMQRDFDIGAEYRDCRFFFRNILNPHVEKLETMVKAVISADKDTKLRSRLESWAKISKALKEQDLANPKTALLAFQMAKIFPVFRQAASEYDSLVALDPESAPWFIADRHHLRDSFLGCVDLLAFAPEDLEPIEDLLRYLNLESRKLSRLVHSVCTPLGKSKRNKRYTLFLRSKAPYITA